MSRLDDAQGPNAEPAAPAAAVLPPPPPADPAADPAAESFYHLNGVDAGGRACQGLACYVARHLGPDRWREACAREPPVYCLGRCYAAPAHGGDEQRPACRIDAREGIVLSRIAGGGARSLEQYRAAGGYEALERALKQPPEAVIGEVEAAGLRGRGGAAFPAARKWRAVFERPAGPKYVVANGDEGDAGAYIDRFILEDDPHCLIEAMAIAGYAVGASRGWVYIRAEYPAARAAMRAAIDEARRAGVLGPRVLGDGPPFDIEVHPGRGGYVCGEETALLNSVAGKRPVAMARPPHPTASGLFGRPTVIHNVETLANVPWIVRRGGAAYHALGCGASRGTKVVSLNSLFNRPGLYEVEFGVPVRHIVEDLGGGLKSGVLKGIMIGGPLAGVVPPDLLDTPFGFEELRAIGAAVGHGGVVAFDGQTSIPQLVRHIFAFGAFESCGKCVPCRLGSRRIEEIFRGVVERGPAPAATRAEWAEVVATLRLASLCGHGSGLAEFAESVMRHYGKELDACFA